MSFQVEPADITDFGKLIGRAGDDADSVSDYLNKYAKLDSKGLVGELWEAPAKEHEEYLSDGQAVVKKMQSVLAAAATELSRAATYYRDTDRDEAQRMDSAYPKSKGHNPSGDGGGGSGGFTDARDIGDCLKPVGGDSGYLGGHVAEYQFAPVHKTIGTVMDLGSPSALANEALKLIFDFDAFGTVLKWVMGDWDGYNACGEAWANVGAACGAVAENVRKGNDRLTYSWDGNAADAASAYFDELANKLEAVESGFKELKGTYDGVAHAIFAFAEFLKAGLAWICDKAIIWMITTAAAAAASATVVGAAAGAASAALAAMQLLQIVMRWGEMVAGLARTATLLNATLLAGSTVAATTYAILQDFPEAGGGYDHKAV